MLSSRLSSTWSILWLWNTNKESPQTQVQKTTWKIVHNIIEQQRQRTSIRKSRLKVASPNGSNCRSTKLEQCNNQGHLFYNNNNDILLRTHGPYHRHKSTKSVLLYISAHYRNGVCTWPTLGGAKQFILSTAVSSFAKAQKMDNHTVGHYCVNVWLLCRCHVVAPAILQSLIVPLCSPRGCCVVLAVS